MANEIKFSTGLDLSNKSILNFVIHASATGSPPSNPVEGMPWYDTTTNQLKIYNGTTWDAITVYTESTGIDITNGAISIDGAYSGLFPNNVHSSLIGNGNDTEIAVTHNLGKQWVSAVVIEVATKAMQITPYVCTSNSVTTFYFGTAPTTNQYRVIIIAGA